jgi:hypothetical protein
LKLAIGDPKVAIRKSNPQAEKERDEENDVAPSLHPILLPIPSKPNRLPGDD